MILYGVGDRLARKKSLYVESYEYLELYDGLWGILMCSFVDCELGCLYKKFWRTL